MVLVSFLFFAPLDCDAYDGDTPAPGKTREFILAVS
jgi:hypothetical protein